MQLKEKKEKRICKEFLQWKIKRENQESFGRISRIIKEEWKKRCYSIYTDLDDPDQSILI